MSEFEDFGGPVNRPAQNARRATPGEALGSPSGAASDAADFLGLNQDLFGTQSAAPAFPMSPAPQPFVQPQVYAEPQYAPQYAPQPQVEPQFQPQPFAQPQYVQPQFAPPPPAPVAEAPAPPSDESWFLETAEEPAAPVIPPAAEREPVAAIDASVLNTSWQEGERKRSSVRWTAPLALAASIAAVALVALPRMRGEGPQEPNEAGSNVVTVLRVGSEESDERASSPIEPIEATHEEPMTEALRPSENETFEPVLAARPEPTQDSLATPREEAVVAPRSALEENGLVEVVDPARAENIEGACPEDGEVIEPATPTVAQPEPSPLQLVASTFVGAPAPVALLQPDAAPAVGPVAPVNPESARTDPPVVPASGNERTTKLEVDQVMLLDRGGSALRQAKASDLESVHLLATIPLESVGAKSKLLTPNVGRVRAVLHSGEIFEGNLYAVGESCLWLDTQYGRMGLDGSRVRAVVQIDVPAGTPALGSPGSQNSTGLDRVRIKTPGGIFYGKIIERTADKTTVICDDGARLTLPSKDVELLTEAPTVRLGGG